MRLSGHQVARLSRTSNLRSAADAIVHLAGFALVIGAAHAAASWWAYAIAVVLIGGLQNRMLIHAHEAWHRKAFKPVWLNQWAGAWLYSYPVGVPFLADQARHLAHHRQVGKPADPDYPDYERSEFHEAARVRRYLVGQLFGMKVVNRLTGASRKEPLSERARSAERRELLGVVLWQLALLALFTWMGRWWEYLLLWALPLGTVTSFIVAFRAYVEHAHEQHDAGPHARLYDFEAGPLTRFFLSPLLFHLHALHHAYPSVPYARLHELRKALAEAGASYPVQQRPNYVRTLQQLLGALESPPREQTQSAS